MIVGVIGSGSIGPDLAYGFVSALSRVKGSKVYLLDIKKEALDAGVSRINGYVKKGLARGKLNPKAAKAIETMLIPTLEIKDLADCDYVLEAATEDLPIKKVILRNLEEVVGKDCLIGFATSGIPRAQIAVEAKLPDRCFVNHPFFPAWRSSPIEIVLSPDQKLGQQMIDTMTTLGKVPIITADVECFAADDIFCNYCSEAARIAEEGVATPAQVDVIVNTAVGGGGPFNVLDGTRGNLLTAHCQELMEGAKTGTPWFKAPAILTKQGNDPWHDPKNPGDSSHDEALKKKVLDRILAVLLARTYFVVDNDICTPRELNWMTRMALGFTDGLLDLADELGADRVHEICTNYAKEHDGFVVPDSIKNKKLVSFYRNLEVKKEGDIATITLMRPEVKNALNKKTLDELEQALKELGSDNAVKGVVLTSFDGSIAGADINELAVLQTPEDNINICRRGHAILNLAAEMKKPVVAAVDGPVLGGGAELSMACHARVVGPHLMLGQPEVNLGIIPGYGGTQRLPRLIGFEKSFDLLRTGRAVGAKEACAWGWAHGEPQKDVVATAKDLIKKHNKGEVKLTPVNPEPIPVPDTLPNLDITYHSLAIDAILLDVLKNGLTKSLKEGLEQEAQGFGRCRATVDIDIGMTNFVQNGPRCPAEFLHE